MEKERNTDVNLQLQFVFSLMFTSFSHCDDDSANFLALKFIDEQRMFSKGQNIWTGGL